MVTLDRLDFVGTDRTGSQHRREDLMAAHGTLFSGDAPGVRGRRPHSQSRARHLEDPHASQAANHRLVPGADGQRRDPGLHRLSRAVQHHARARQGRHPLSPRRHARRSDGARGVDDVEVRGRAAAVRRRQGRRHLRSDEDVEARARGADAPLHRGDHRRDRPRQGRARARRQHQRADHGVVLGHLLDARRPHARPPSSPASRWRWAARSAAAKRPAAA